WVASHAQRVIHIRDGLIVDGEFDPDADDDVGGEGERPAPARGPSTHRAVATPPRRRTGPGPVRRAAPARPGLLLGLLGVAFLYLRTFRMAVRSLRRNILRSILTTLGIVIGIAAVITMMEIGQGSSSAIQRTITSMGANTLLVAPGTTTNSGISQGVGAANTLTAEDAEAIHRECPAVATVAPVVRARTQVVDGNRNWVPQYIFGT